MFTKKRLFSGLYAQEFIYHHQLVELEGWLACLLCLEPDGEEIAGALYGWHLLAAYSALELGSHYGDIIGVDETVAVDIALAYVALEVLVAPAQSAVVEIRGEVVLVDAPRRG